MSKKTLNKTNLEALGADRLADLLLEVSSGSADIKRRLRLELSHNLGPAELAHDVRKRLATLRKSTSFVGWRKRKALIKDLTTQVTMIVDRIGPDDPSAAFDLLWQFIELAPAIYMRVDDSKGDVGAVFRTAITAFDKIAPRALLDPKALADQVWSAVCDNGYGEWDGIITRLSPTLGHTGLAQLKRHAQQHLESPDVKEQNTHEAIEFLRQLRGGPTYAADKKARFVKAVLQEIAAATGDTEGYITQFSEQDLQRPKIAAEVATLLMQQNRASDAFHVLIQADLAHAGPDQDAWDDAYVACLVAQDRGEDAQAFRLNCFMETLRPEPLRDYLKELPDFDDVEAEDRAKAHALTFPHALKALKFLIEWPDLLSAATLVEQRFDEIDGDYFAFLTPTAEALRHRYPLAAVLLWRAMINATLTRGAASRYVYAANDLNDCALCDAQIEDYGHFKSHSEYVEDLRSHHAHKKSFWTKIP